MNLGEEPLGILKNLGFYLLLCGTRFLKGLRNLKKREENKRW